MAVPGPVSQMWAVSSYVVGQKLRGRKQYPLVLMLEPLFRCNLACAGCGKIQYPAHVLKMQLTPEECFRAVDECAAPTVAIPGASLCCILRYRKLWPDWRPGRNTSISAPTP